MSRPTIKLNLKLLIFTAVLLAVFAVPVIFNLSSVIPAALSVIPNLIWNPESVHSPLDSGFHQNDSSTREFPVFAGTAQPDLSAVAVAKADPGYIAIDIDYIVDPWACGQDITDSRDSQVYSTVEIGDQCWMRENMNVGTLIEFDFLNNQTNNSIIEKYCYDNIEANCTTYGGLYQWDETMQYAASCNGTGVSPDDACATPVQGICPTGWHIPSHYEITTLERAVCTSGSCATDFPYDETTTGWRGTDEGATLKMVDSTHFSILQSGLVGFFMGFGSLLEGSGCWSSFSLEADSDYAWRRTYNASENRIYYGNNALKTNGYSVRCIQDAAPAGPSTLYWVGGTGNWSDDDNHWATTSGGSAGDGNVPAEGDNVVFDASSGTGTVTIDAASVSVGTLTASSNNITIDTSTNGITVTGAMTVTATISGTAAVTFSGGTITSGDTTVTISAPLTLAADTTVFVDTGATTTISGGVSGDYAILKTGTGILRLIGASTFSEGLNIKAGTVSSSSPWNATCYGTGTITIGDSEGSADAALYGGSTINIANPITIAAGSSGTLSINSAGTSTFSGAITLNNNLTINADSYAFNINGGITGTGNVILNVNTTYAAYLQTTSINNVGTITNSGTGTGTTTISAVIGSNVTGVIQNSATSQLTLSGNNADFAGGVTIKAGTVMLSTSANAAGTGTITIGDTSGSADATLKGTNSLTFANAITAASGSSGTLKIYNMSLYNLVFSGIVTLNNNLTISPIGLGSITLSGGFVGTGNIIINNTNVGETAIQTTSINHAGTITNSGTGSGTTTISGVIGSAVTGVIQNSATSALTLSNASNTFTGDVTVSAGTLNVTQNNTFDTLTIAGDATFNPTNGKTITLTDLVSTGTAGHLAIIKSASAGNAASLTTVSSLILTDYLSVTDSTPVEENTWFAGANGSLVSNTGYWALVPTDYTWDAGGDGTTWTDADNWDVGSGYPDTNAETATINTGSASITTPTGLTLGALTLGASYTGTVTMEDSLTIDDAGGKTGDLTVSGGTLQTDKDEVSNITADGDITVADNATIIVRRSSTTGEGAGQTITAANITITGDTDVSGTPGRIHADGEGFDANSGPGVSTGTNEGGTHGGRGSNGTIGQTYGSLINPTSLGSGGEDNPGGGSIVVSVSNAFVVNGTLSADGINTISGGGGSGGSINISASSLSGSGVIRSNGADSTGDGGGGRVSLNGVTTDNFVGTLQAKSNGVNGPRGYTGTIYLNSTKRSNLVLGGEGNLSSLRLGTDDDASSYNFGAITIQSGGVLEIDGNPSLNSDNGGAAVLNITTLDVQIDGIFSANGLGFSRKQGPGYGAGRDGGSYGGEGGDYLADGTVAPTYGSITNPIYLGSGGDGDSVGAGAGNGGGAILIIASGTVTVNGTLSANGENGYGTGAGGSVNISTTALDGSGIITANAGPSSHSRASGGGGRVAIMQTSGTSWSPTITAYGGSIAYGAAGTIYLQDANDGANGGELIINNNNVATASGTDTTISSSVTDTSVGTVTITASKAGKLTIDSGQSLTAGTGGITIGTGTTLTNAGTIYDAGSFTNSGTYTDTSGTVTFNGTSTVAGATTFYNLALAAGSAAHLTSGQTFTVSNNFTTTATSGSHAVINATTPSSVAYLPITGTADVDYVDGTDIDSSTGTEVDNQPGGTTTTCVNWVSDDSTPPTTTASATADGEAYTFDSWTNATSVSVVLTCDDGSGTGCAQTLYCTDTENGCTPTTEYSSAVEITDEGTTYIRYYSTDTVPNTEATNSQIIKIDRTAPATLATAQAGTGVYTFGETSTVAATVTLTCADPSAGSGQAGSGCLTTLYCTDSSNACTPETAYTAPVEISTTGTSYIRYFSTDSALNAETTNSQTIVISSSSSSNSSSAGSGAYNLMLENPVSQVSNQLNNLAQKASEIASLLTPFAPRNDGESELGDLPPVEEVVLKEAPVALKGWDLLTVKPFSELALTSVSSDIAFYASKFPQLAQALERVGVNVKNSQGVEKLSGIGLYVPGLTQTVLNKSEIAKINEFTPTVIPGLTRDPDDVDSRFRGNDTEGGGNDTGEDMPKPEVKPNLFAQVQGVPVAELPAEALAKIPSNMVFAMGASQLINFGSQLAVDAFGNVQQIIHAVAGKPMQLTIKPDQPAERVMGFMTLKKLASNQGREQKFLFPTDGIASLLASLAPRNDGEGTDGGTTGVLVQKFEYELVKSGVYLANITAPASEGEYEIMTVVQYKDENLNSKETTLTAVVDPEGYVYSNTKDGRLAIEGAQVSLWWLNPESAKYEMWPAEQFLQKNPVKTNATGKYSFLAPEGAYYIEAKAQGYKDYKSAVFDVKENNNITIDIEMQKQATWLSWFNWQILIVILIGAVIILLIVLIFKKK